MKKLHKLLMTSTAIVCIFGCNIYSTPVAAKPNYIGSWYNVGLSNEYISRYRVFQKDGQVHDYQKLKTGLIGSSYHINGIIESFQMVQSEFSVY